MSTPIARGITETDVWRAADALLLEGARPTIERIRTKIGRGSPNTVSPYLDTWFRSLGARIVDPMAFSAPPALPDPIAEAAKHFWEAALVAARAEAAALLGADRAELSHLREHVEDERSRLQAEAEKVAAQLVAKDEALRILADRSKELSDQLNTRSAELQQRGNTIDLLGAELTELRADRQSLHAQRDADRATFEASRQEWNLRMTNHEERWAAEVDRAREAAKSTNARYAQLEKDFAQRVGQLAKSMEAMERDRQRASEARLQIQQNLDKLLEEHAAVLARLREDAREREIALRAQYERVQTQLSEALDQSAAKDREHGELLRTLVANTRKYSTRRQRSPGSR